MCRVTNQQTRLPRATSSLALNASRDGAPTTSLSIFLSKTCGRFPFYTELHVLWFISDWLFLRNDTVSALVKLEGCWIIYNYLSIQPSWKSENNLTSSVSIPTCYHGLEGEKKKYVKCHRHTIITVNTLTYLDSLLGRTEKKTFVSQKQFQDTRKWNNFVHKIYSFWNFLYC